jgi:hypothetical protein
MGVFANLVLGLGGVIALIGFLFFWLPILGIPLIVIGGGLVFIGQVLRREARKQAVRRQMGG